ncbi:hypothetical protein [Enterocloster bolteae]|uniref:hypothetical protein n=1 Tax=Enterocloster bolteae TaxID=208479 RepID=UPI002A819A5C|nr:hypothetical protein [Enterocloster bolteae]
MCRPGRRKRRSKKSQYSWFTVYEMQTSALIKAVHHYLDSLFQLNVIDMMEEVYRVTRVNMSEAEKRQFYEKYVKPMHLVTDKNAMLQ